MSSLDRRLEELREANRRVLRASRFAQAEGNRHRLRKHRLPLQIAAARIKLERLVDEARAIGLSC